jgi:formylglycine-generating enzyme required for sulfatase activity
VPDDAGWGRGERPVINVTYEQITNQFLPWLQRKTGLVFRLPSEAEWEYAARASGNTRYYWGAAADGAYANGSQSRGWQADGHEFTAPAGSYRANAFGLFDTSGNVWEWTSECLLKAVGSNAATRQTERDCDRRIVKGGSWLSPPELLTPTQRADQSRFDKNNDRGFRLALDY